jgi:hypothetical protein
MAGYVVLAVFAIVGVWVFIHVRRMPRMPARRPFDNEGNSLIEQERQPSMPFNPPPGPGDGGGFGL